jgi:hypothetical protein
MLKGVSVARLTLWKPPAPIISRSRASPACMIEEVRFAEDSPLEGSGFEPSVPRERG